MTSLLTYVRVFRPVEHMFYLRIARTNKSNLQTICLDFQQQTGRSLDIWLRASGFDYQLGTDQRVTFEP